MKLTPKHLLPELSRSIFLVFFLSPRMRPILTVLATLITITATSARLSAQYDKTPPITIADAVANTAAEMKPYAEPLEHTSFKIEMVPIPGGTFRMGSPEGEAERRDDEGPQHEVRISPFWMSRHEITWNQYEVWGERVDSLRRAAYNKPATPRDKIADSVTRPTPPYTDMSFGMGRENNPAICMTQHAARMYCTWLSAKTGRYYRLPTEAEWEYACRAGTTTAYFFGDDPEQLGEYAWYEANSDGHYQPVGRKKPNPWGLFDMHGNVAEWVLDQYAPDTYAQRKEAVADPLAIPLMEYPRVVRGGGWDDPAAMLRSAVREGSSLEWKQQDPQIPQSIWYFTDALGVGFRVVRPLVEPEEAEKAGKWEKSEPPQKDPEEGPAVE
ncbi:MAG: Serine/threonine-protein kinase pkn1 [Planctomycetota bacterium]|jgi:formylglycine-generating enzyme required for sulfatase activity